MAAYGGVNTTAPVGAAAPASGTGTAMTAPSVTTTTSGTKLVALYGLATATSVTPPSAMTERWDVANPGLLAATTSAMADADQPGAGATGPRPATAATSTDWVAHLVALTPARVTTTVRYGFSAPGDSPAVTMDGSGAVIERTVALVGGVLLTKRAADDVWSYPNVHGDVMAIADGSGAKQGPTLSYDPYGQPLGGLADNSAGNFDYGWLGAHHRGLEHAPGIATIEMGARQYVPKLGRFLEVDPVEGGCANDYVYVYVFGDPVNESDLDGMGAREWVRERARNVKNIGRGAWNSVSRNVLTCADTTFTRAAGALSLAPPFGEGGSKRAWGGSAAGWLNFVVGYGAGAAGSGKLDAVAPAGLAGTAVRVGSRVSTAVAFGSTAYDLTRRFVCRNR